MKIASWNVNSIRMRLPRTLAFLERHQPDVLCLQETKVRDEDFPVQEFTERGYHVEHHGQRAYNGVAILSRAPAADVMRGLEDGVEDVQSRLIAATVGGVRIYNVYVPNGQRPDSDKFVYKLAWIDRLRRHLDAHHRPEDALLVCGDFNIAPEDRDVYDPDAWRGHVLFHPREHAALRHLAEFGLVDAFRLHCADGGHYTWWDYRAGNFWKNKGLRIDHFLLSRGLAGRCFAVDIDTWERKGKLPSDHAPVLLTLAAAAPAPAGSGPRAPAPP